MKQRLFCKFLCLDYCGLFNMVNCNSDNPQKEKIGKLLNKLNYSSMSRKDIRRVGFFYSIILLFAKIVLADLVSRRIIFYERYLPTIGILRPCPKALGETLKIGGVWCRFHSFIFTIRRTRFTIASSKPDSIRSAGLW